MRKYLRNITVGAALLLLAGSCTDKFEEYNTNQYQIHDADPATLMKSMIETIVNIQQNDSQMQDQMVGQLGGYLCCSNTWSGTNFSTFNQSDAWNATPWNTPFEKIYGNFFQIQEATNSTGHYYAFACMIRAITMLRVADCYGPLVYSKFGQEGDNVDDLKTAYKQFFTDLEKGITSLQSFIKDNPGVEPYKDADMLTPNKTLAEWVKFGNSLRLRLAMRVANVDKALATEQAQKSFTLEQFLEAPNEIISVSTAGGYNNPLGEINKSWGEVFMGATMESVLTGYDDPRMSKYYDPANGAVITWKENDVVKELPQLFEYAGSYKGVPQGTGLLSADNRYKECSKSTVSQKTNPILMTAAEVWFLRAEAALRGISTEDPKICYETGVKTSFEQWGVGGVDAYLQSDKTPADYKDPFDTQFDMNARITTTPNWADANGTEEQFEKIMTQKWLAIYPEGNEAWTEQRRTGYPKLFKVKVNNSGGAINTDEMIRRLPYPEGLKTSNPTQYSSLTRALGGADTGGTRLWWDAGKNNF